MRRLGSSIPRFRARSGAAECAVKHAASVLKADRKFMFEAVKKNGNSLGFAAREHKGVRKAVLEAVDQIGNSLEHAAPELNANRKFVLEAMRRNVRWCSKP